MIKRLFYLCIISLSYVCASCDDNDSFTSDSSDVLTFSIDTLSMDTVFSTVPTSTKTFWVYNYSSDGLRLRHVRLQRGNQSGFRVNVDGIYLDNSQGSQASDFEVRQGDSIRVFVELTSSMTGSVEPQLVEDNILFHLESGVEQKVNLRAWSWDAILCDSIIISSDSLIASQKPIVVRRGIKIDSTATLTINAPTNMYFHNKAGIDVYGRVIIKGRVGEDVVLRGDRTDNMFDYLPYDRVSGQWRGIHIYPSSSDNILSFVDLHSAEDGIICDSMEYDENQIRLSLDHVTIHNCKGYGLKTYNSNVVVSNSQITNTLGDCVAVYGGKAQFVYCTIAQFYPFDAERGAALRFSNYYGDGTYPLYAFDCYNTLVTGYADDVVMGESRDDEIMFGYHFENCILRTPKPDNFSFEDSIFVNTIFELPENKGETHFIDVDIDKQYYDFHLDSLSTARQNAVALMYYTDDRDGKMRPDSADIGCYQYVK